MKTKYEVEVFNSAYIRMPRYKRFHSTLESAREVAERLNSNQAVISGGGRAFVSDEKGRQYAA